MLTVIAVVFGLIILNKLVGIHMQSDFIKQAVEEELKIVK